MATANFRKCAERNYYALILEGSEYDAWNMVYNDILEGFCARFHGNETKSKRYDRDRVFTFIADATDRAYYGNNVFGEFEVKFHFTSGYYVGATIGYDIVSVANGCSLYENGFDEVVDDMVEDALEYAPYSWNEGMKKIHKARVRKAFERVLEDAIDKLEGFCKEYCEEVLCVSAMFSNGETFYDKVS